MIMTKLFPVAVVLEDTFDSESLLGWKNSSLHQLDEIALKPNKTCYL